MVPTRDGRPSKRREVAETKRTPAAEAGFTSRAHLRGLKKVQLQFHLLTKLSYCTMCMKIASGQTVGEVNKGDAAGVTVVQTKEKERETKREREGWREVGRELKV